jgi:hypothetical protein
MKTIVKAIACLHLFGLNTPNYKGVFEASLSDIILCKDSREITHTTNKSYERNTNQHIDTELKELRTFIKDCINGQTYAVELLYTPKQMILESSTAWEFIRQNRHKLTPNDLTPFCSYAFSQSQKYSQNRGGEAPCFS